MNFSSTQNPLSLEMSSLDVCSQPAAASTPRLNHFVHSSQGLTDVVKEFE